MTELSQLTDEQAIKAVNFLYQITPGELWQDELKPKPARLGAVAASLQDNAGGEAKELIGGVMSSDAAALPLRAALAKVILARASAIPELQSYVSRSIDASKQEVLAFDPLTGAIIIGMLLAVPTIEIKGKDGASAKVSASEGLSHVLSALDIKGILHELPAVISALPKEVLSKFFPSLKGPSDAA